MSKKRAPLTGRPVASYAQPRVQRATVEPTETEKDARTMTRMLDNEWKGLSFTIDFVTDYKYGLDASIRVKPARDRIVNAALERKALAAMEPHIRRALLAGRAVYAEHAVAELEATGQHIEEKKAQLSPWQRIRGALSVVLGGGGELSESEAGSLSEVDNEESSL